jgi:hypothetical protein
VGNSTIDRKTGIMQISCFLNAIFPGMYLGTDKRAKAVIEAMFGGID